MRVLTTLLGTLLLLAASACAPTQSGVVLRADDWNDTLRIDGEVYLLTPHSQLFGADGHPIRLHQVPTVADPGIGVRHASRARVDFLAREYHGRWYLDRLWVRTP